MRLEARPEHGGLSDHQRLEVGILAFIDGKEIVKRPASGEMLFLMAIIDSTGRRFENHGNLSLRHAGLDSGRAEIEFFQGVLILPGDYDIQMVVVHTATGDHAVARRKIHISPLNGDPLRDSWRNLPAIEFIRSDIDPPDRWYQPGVIGRLSLALESRTPVHIELLVNATATEEAGLKQYRDRAMARVLSAMKVLSQIQVRRGALDLTMVDLERRRVSFSQTSVSQIEWRKLRDALSGGSGDTIDVESLANHARAADFFAGEVGRRVQTANVLIVLSAPMAFSRDVERHPIELAERPNCRVFYIRLSPRPSVAGFFPEPSSRSPRGQPIREISPLPQGPPSNDFLGSLLKPLQPEVFDAASPLEFRHALAKILNEIAR